MILADEAEVLEEAFHRSDVGDVTQFEYKEEDILGYIEYLGIERSILPDLQDYFSVKEKSLCEKHRVPINACGCGDTREAEMRVFQLNADALFNQWVESLSDRGIFESIDVEKRSDSRWEISAWLDRTNLTLQAFFNRDEFEVYDFEPHSLEFGVSFFGDVSSIDRDYCYSWSQFLENEFRDDLIRDVKGLKEAIGSDFYEYVPLEEFRDRVRKSLRDYFDESGYLVSREVGKVCPVETTHYNIDTGQTDFVAYNEASKFVVCHCENSHGWHVHHFSDGRIESAETTPIVEDMTPKIESKINEKQDIRLNKVAASRLVKVLATFFSIGFVILLFDRLSTIGPVLQEYLPIEGNLEVVGVVLLVLDGMAALALAVVVIRPFVRDYWFDWGIEPYGESS